MELAIKSGCLACHAVDKKLSTAANLTNSIAAFDLMQKLRLRLQQTDTAAGQANRIDPEELNELDRLILKEAFKQAKKLQQRLQLEYRL